MGLDGTLLSTGTFTSETATGGSSCCSRHRWPSPPGTYVASYHAPTATTRLTSNYFASPLDQRPAARPRPTTNGVYQYGAGGFPQQLSRPPTTGSTWCSASTQPADLVPPVVSSVAPVNGATSVPTTAGLTVSFDEAMTAGSIAMTVVGPGGAAAGTVTL